MKTGLLILSFALLGAALAAPPAATTSPKKTPVARTPAKSKITTSKTRKAVTKSTGKKGNGLPQTTWRNRQQAPTPDRYKEIQQALAAKGYLKQEPNGVWDAQSVDALKQYQTENKMQPTGKITSSGLIGLGLGPKPAEPTTPVTVPPPIPPPQG